MKKDNRGLSLVELIVVMAIMATLTMVVGISVTLATSRPADQCAAGLQSIIQKNRITTMGKLNANLKIYLDADGCICVDETVETAASSTSTVTTRVGAEGVVLRYKLSGESGFRELTAGTSLILSFDRSSGAFKDLTAMGFPGQYCEIIEIVKGNRVKVLRLSYLTGKVSLE